MKHVMPVVVSAVLMSAAVAAAPTSSAAPEPVTILSSSWGLNDGTGCPNGVKSLDNIPTTFNWFIRTSSIDVTDFVITRDDGTTTTPVCALQFPPNERNEHQTVNLIGDFGDPSGARPVTVTVVGDLEGRPINQRKWRDIAPGLTHPVDQIEGGPYMVDSWMLTKAQLKGDRNRCTVGENFVRVVWSNGLTAYPDGSEVGQPAVDSYRAIFALPSGKVIRVTPLAVGDLADHAKTANDDNMHDLCLPALPKGAVLNAVTIGADQIQDPNGDPNDKQKLG
ncbi:MAG: hypothetical protein K9G80_06395 [Candidatus Nanopelagicales bacterium]|nr:hypothetical protein [Candidatus Nanopelagicales bacterium]MCF8556232.1 hypothetical protein [Candidatus Nanopelagicales bacterium]